MFEKDAKERARKLDHCDIKKKNVNLGNWDFNYCPFCGQEIKEND